MEATKINTFVYVINVDWYFDLHWIQRASATLATGATVHVIMGVTDAVIVERCQKLGFICHEWNVDRKSMNPFSNFQKLLTLYRLIKSISPDMVHAITVKPNIYVGLLSYLLKLPYVLSVTGTGIIFSSKSFTMACIRPLVRGLYKLSKTKKIPRKIIFENWEDRDYFINSDLCESNEAVTILGAGVDINLFAFVDENNAKPPMILFAARLLWDKGLQDLMAAARLLRERGEQFEIKVAGIVDNSTINGIDQASLDSWCDEGLIQWLGTEKEMPALISAANIVVLPTFYGEGVPRILIEAAACGRAIITTNIAGCREIVKHERNGLLVIPRDVEGLAEAITRLLANPQQRYKMGLQGREMVVQDFSEQKVIAETLALYKELLK